MSKSKNTYSIGSDEIELRLEKENCSIGVECTENQGQIIISLIPKNVDENFSPSSIPILYKEMADQIIDYLSKNKNYLPSK